MENTQELRTEIQHLKKSSRRNKVSLLIMFGLLLCLSVFSYVQRSEAQLQKKLSEELMSRAQEAQKQAAINAEYMTLAEQTCNRKLIECEQKK